MQPRPPAKRKLMVDPRPPVKKAPLKPIKIAKPKNLRELKVTPITSGAKKPIIKTAMKKKVI
jgi:hypothetical protein